MYFEKKKNEIGKIKVQMVQRKYLLLAKNCNWLTHGGLVLETLLKYFYFC